MRLASVLLGLSLAPSPARAVSEVPREREEGETWLATQSSSVAPPEVDQALATRITAARPGAVRATPLVVLRNQPAAAEEQTVVRDVDRDEQQPAEAATLLERSAEDTDEQAVARDLVVGRASRTVELAPPAAAQSVSAAPVTAALPRLARVRRSAALLVLSGPALAAGAALAVLGSRSFHRHVGSCALGWDKPLCIESAILDNARTGAAGGGLIGAGLGLVAAGVTAATPVRRRVWVIEAITGGALLALGAAWLGAEHLAYPRFGVDDYLARVGPWFDRRVVAASLLGAGLGLSLGAGVGLLPPSRRARATAWAPLVSPTGVGLIARF